MIDSGVYTTNNTTRKRWKTSTQIIRFMTPTCKRSRALRLKHDHTVSSKKRGKEASCHGGARAIAQWLFSRSSSTVADVEYNCHRFQPSLSDFHYVSLHNCDHLMSWHCRELYLSTINNSHHMLTTPTLSASGYVKDSNVIAARSSWICAVWLGLESRL